jgi:phenylacetate-CoA ligase
MSRDPRAALDRFLATPLAELLEGAGRPDPAAAALALFHDVAARVPAYRSLLAEHGIDPSTVQSPADFARLPLVTRENYIKRYPLAARCRDGSLSSCDMLALSSGSTGEPTAWPRANADELGIATRFEQLFHDNFDADRRSTLAVVCFPLGTWIGGMFTASCCRHVAAKGYPLVTVTPGNQKQEIYRALKIFGPELDQVVLLGYPPFLKDVIDGGPASGIDWSSLRVRLVLAGEVVSEEWRALMAERAHLQRPLYDIASMYGTADAGVLGVETPIAAAIRGFAARDGSFARALFGEARLPTLVQYDPLSRYFEVSEGTLLFTGDNGVPLVRYHISDVGGIRGYDEMLATCRAHGFDPIAAADAEGERGRRRLPFVWVFGRSHFAVSFYGANVFPEMVAVGLEQPGVHERVTGKFVMEVTATGLTIAVELAEGKDAPAGFADEVARSIASALTHLSSEYASYVPPERRAPLVTLWPARHPEYFPTGVKHRYSR